MNQTNVFVVGPSWIGDMVMAQALFKLLKSRQDVAIDVLAPQWSSPVLERMPEIRRIIPMPIGHGQLKLTERYRIAARLRSENYQQAFVLPHSYKSALIPFFANIPKRTGWCGEMRWGLLNDIHYLRQSNWALMVQRYLALGLPVGDSVPDIRPSLEIDMTSVQATLAKYVENHDKQPVLGICPGAEFGPAKRWPAEYYVEVVKEYRAAGWQVWLFGSAKDSEIAQSIQAACSNACLDLTGKTSLGEVIDLLSQVNVVLTNDSGLMHIAAALSKPLVAVYGSSTPNYTPPLSEKNEILSLAMDCKPCFKRVCPLKHRNCMYDIKPKMVIDSIDKLERCS